MLSSATWQNLNFRSHEIIRVPVSIYIYGCNLCMWEDFFQGQIMNKLHDCQKGFYH